ncbi:MAG: hypothetical protein M1819_005020 [Sarea resinae]|nr:MAG: hypothetical protein M1819_005020 [Sarea resinae]
MAPSRASIVFNASSVARITRQSINRRTLTQASSFRRAASVPVRILSPSTCRERHYSTPSDVVTEAKSAVDAASSSPSQEGLPEPPTYLSEGERHVFDKLQQELTPTELEVQDISGGCGSMYAISITGAPQFRGLSTIKQHRLVNDVLGDEIKSWHGVQLRTKIE